MRRAAEPRAWAGLLLLLVLGCAKEEPIPARSGLLVSLGADSAGLGEPVRLSVEAVLPTGWLPAIPGETDSLGAWAILGVGPMRQEGSGDWKRWSREVQIAGFSLGWIGPESLHVAAVDGSGDTMRVSAAAPALHIGGEIPAETPPDPASARDIRDVVRTGPILWPYWVAGGLLLVALFVLLVHFLRSRRLPLLAREHPVTIDPEVEFEEAIRRLLAARHLEEGRIREYYYGISDAVRLFLGRVHGLPLRESTSGEVARRLAPRIEMEENRLALDGWLREGDLVKYARLDRLQQEAKSYLERSRELVRRLRPAPVPSAPQGPEGRR